MLVTVVVVMFELGIVRDFCSDVGRLFGVARVTGWPNVSRDGVWLLVEFHQVDGWCRQTAALQCV